MSRFGTYLAAKKLARLQIQTAVDKFNKKDERAALGYILAALPDMLTAMNCLASIQFEPRRKRRRPSKA